MFILTVRNDGLGDLILALPTLSALRRRYPEARLGAVVAPRWAMLFELFPETVDVWGDGVESRKRLRRERPDVALFLRADRGWAAAAFWARVPRRIGTRHRWQSMFFNERADVHRRDAGLHEAQCNLQVAAALGIEARLEPPRLSVPERHRERARTFRKLCGFAPDEPYVVLHPGSHGSAPNWRPDRYAALARLLSDRGVHVLVTGSASESELVRHVAGVSGSTAGETDLAILAAHLRDASAVVAGSTGPMHLAAALGVPVVALFSSQGSHAPVRWGPLGEAHVVLQSDSSRDGGASADLSGISESEVARAVDLQLRARRAAT